MWYFLTSLFILSLFIFLPVNILAATAGPEPKVLLELEDVFRYIVGLIAAIAGFAFFAMIIFGSFKLLTAGNDPKAVAEARNVLTFAALGLFLIVSAWLMLELIERITGVPITIFSLPLPAGIHP